ncbi:MAG: glycosyltransferase [Methylococcales bacterium]
MSIEVLAGKKPRLLLILPANVIGGAETRSHKLLRDLHFDCALLTQASIADFYRGLGVRIYLFDDHGCVNPCLLSPGNILRYAWAVKTVAWRERPDLVLGLMHNGTLFASVAKSLFFMKSALVGTILGNISAYFASAGRSPSLMERWIIHTCLNTPSGIVSPSRGVIDDLIENYGAPPEKLELIYNGVDIIGLREAARAPAPGIDKDRPWIVSACRFSSQKDFRTLLTAFRAVRLKRPLKLVLVGDGELREDICQIAAELGVANDLILTGFRDNPFPYMAKADVFVLSSFFEGFGNVIVEAMALGVPVVATDCPSGPREIICDGENGFLVPVRDWQAMAERCLLLLENPERRDSLIESGLERAESFGVDAMAAAFDRYLAAALAKRAGLKILGKSAQQR